MKFVQRIQNIDCVSLDLTRGFFPEKRPILSQLLFLNIPAQNFPAQN